MPRLPLSTKPFRLSRYFYERSIWARPARGTSNVPWSSSLFASDAARNFLIYGFRAGCTLANHVSSIRPIFFSSTSEPPLPMAALVEYAFLGAAAAATQQTGQATTWAVPCASPARMSVSLPSSTNGIFFPTFCSFLISRFDWPFSDSSSPVGSRMDCSGSSLRIYMVKPFVSIPIFGFVRKAFAFACSGHGICMI